jgi:predicted transcriptional regulator
MDAATLRERVTRKLIEDIQQVEYPSVTMMDRVEAVLATDTLGDYAEALLEKIEASRFPSISMLNRLDGLIAQLEQAERQSNGAGQPR